MTTRSDHDLQLGKLIAGAAAGALMMYLLDPERGASRRAAAADTLRQAGRDASQAVTGAVQDLSHRAGAADVFHANDNDAVDTRAAGGLMPQAFGGLSKLLSKPAHAIETIAQGLRERSWDPATRNAALVGGGTLGLLGLLARRSPVALAAGLAGAALLAGSARKRPLASLLRSRASGTVDLERTIRIDASPGQVYDMWANYENFPRFMANVIEVRDLGANLSRWTVKGPAGVAYEWNSMLTEQSRPHRLAWRSIPGGDIDQHGEVRLEPVHGGTRVSVHLHYAPPAGQAGQALATLLGSNPKAQLDDDLQRLKHLLEKGGLLHAGGQTAASSGKFLH